MNRRQWIGGIGLASVATAAPAARNRFIGVWKLVSCERKSKDGRIDYPYGEKPIGRITYHWIDSSRAESFAPDSGRRREVLVDVWYPATGAGGRERASYLPNLSLLHSVFDEQGMTRRFAPAYAVMRSGRLRTHAFEGPPPPVPARGMPGTDLLSRWGRRTRVLHGASQTRARRLQMAHHRALIV